MDHRAAQIEQAVDEVTARVQSLLKDLDFRELPSIAIDSLEACDKIPRGIPCLYFVHHPSFGLLYLGKAVDLRRRWKAEGRIGQLRTALHQIHKRCIEIGNVTLSWFQLDPRAHEIAETIAIRFFHPWWNTRKKADECLREGRAPSLYSDGGWIERYGSSNFGNSGFSGA